MFVRRRFCFIIQAGTDRVNVVWVDFDLQRVGFYWLRRIPSPPPPSVATAATGPRPVHYQGFMITLRHTPQSVGLLWTSDQLVADTSTWQHTTLRIDIHAPSGVRTRNPSKRAAADSRLKPRCRWDRLLRPIAIIIIIIISYVNCVTVWEVCSWEAPCREEIFKARVDLQTSLIERRKRNQ